MTATDTREGAVRHEDWMAAATEEYRGGIPF
jgi:hypothetical protein